MFPLNYFKFSLVFLQTSQMKNVINWGGAKRFNAKIAKIEGEHLNEGNWASKWSIIENSKLNFELKRFYFVFID